MTYDYLIVGQGLAGSSLAYHLLKEKQKIIIIDEFKKSLPSVISDKIVSSFSNSNLAAAHKIASTFYNTLGEKVTAKALSPGRIIGGLITPVTGKRLLKTWLADQVLPFARDFYTMLEKQFNSSFYFPKPIVRIFVSAVQANDWAAKCNLEEFKDYVDLDYQFENDALNIKEGYTVFKNGAMVDGSLLLRDFTAYFRAHSKIISESFSYKDLEIKNSPVHYKDFSARRIVFCEGWKGAQNPLFSDLPFMPSKGELLVIQSEKLRLNEIINRGIFIRPLAADFYLVGSTYSWDDLTTTPTQKGLDELTGKLKTLLNVPFKVINRFAGIRPTVHNRRPFLGRHAHYKNVFIFNGLGTKGLLLAPYFADHMAKFLLGGSKIIPDVDIARFYS